MLQEMLSEPINLEDGEQIKRVRSRLSKETGVDEQDVGLMITTVTRAYDAFNRDMNKAVAEVMAKTTVDAKLPPDEKLFEFFLTNLVVNYSCALMKGKPVEEQERWLQILRNAFARNATTN